MAQQQTEPSYDCFLGRSYAWSGSNGWQYSTEKSQSGRIAVNAFYYCVYIVATDGLKSTCCSALVAAPVLIGVLSLDLPGLAW